MTLIPSTQTLKASSAKDALAAVPEEQVWLANFTSSRTKATYANAVREMVGFLGIDSPEQLYDIDQAHVIAWRDQLAAEGASPRTISNRLSAVSSLFAHLCEKQICAKNPVSGVKRPKVASHSVETPALSRAQVRAMLDAPDAETLQGLRDRALMHVYFYTGCRESEPCALRVRDFHQDQGYWVLDFTVKGGKRNRVAVHPECQHALASYIEAMRNEYSDSYCRDAWIFQAIFNGKSGRPMTRQRFYQLFKKYAAEADLPEGVVPHSARATFITEALDRDHPAEAVQKTVGHASITTTLAYDKRDHHPKNSASFAVRY
ncbi:MAG: tyrosine-type recombinase/integrase [Pseudomonadota bacterium]